MKADNDGLETALLTLLRQRGMATSGELQARFGLSQPTLSRALQALAPHLLTLGAGRNTRYAMPQPIVGRAAQQPLFWVHADGRFEPLGMLSFLSNERVHVQGEGIDIARQGQLPWFLAPLRAEGFLGRALARQLAGVGLPGDPHAWSLEQALLAALHTHDAPGAIVLGEPQAALLPALDHDALAQAVTSQASAGSSAGGEQPKFLARRSDGAAVLVKFTPPRGTPYGERWHDLLHAEALALQVLHEQSVPVAATRIVSTSRRTYLESERFDRVGRHGRLHVVPLRAAHEAFVPGAMQHWAASCEGLVRQGRLPPEAGRQAAALRHFGRLIGNTDMHFGNLSLRVARDDLARGRFTLAPLYDMLPMRWRPDPHADGEIGPTPFEPEPLDLQSAARPLAQQYWERVAEHAEIGKPTRALAKVMALRVKATA